LLKTLRHEVVLVNVFGGQAFGYESLAIWYARLCGRRTVAMLRSGRLPAFVKRHPRLAKWVLSKPDLVVTPSSFLRESLSALGLRIDGIIPNFIELEKYPYRRRAKLEPRFLYLRGMHPQYNPEMTLRAFALIQQQVPTAQLTFAGGEFSLGDHFRALAKELNLSNVAFLGLVPKEEVQRLMNAHDIYIQSNREENMPISVIEAWASGLPVLSTNVGGIAHMVRDREDALLVPSEDHAALARAALELLADSDLVSRLTANGRTRALELTWERVAPRWRQALALDDEWPAQTD
jgi:glycosyltransferase involved in cell wall biosynthesis